MKRVTIVLISVVVLVGLFGVCKPEPARASSSKVALPSTLDIGTGSVGGSFYLAGSIIGKLLEKELGIGVIVTPTEGSAECVRLLDRGEMKMALISANAASPAYSGMLAWKKKYTRMRALIGTWNSPTGFVTLRKTGITDFAQLKGRRVCVGAGPSTWDPIARPIFEAHGIDYDKELKKMYAGFTGGHTMLGDRRVDAVISVCGGGVTWTPATAKLMAERDDVVVIKLDPKAIDEVVRKYPWFTHAVIRKEAAKSTEDVPTYDMGGPHLYARPDMNEDVAYVITKTIHENLDKLAGKFKRFKYPMDDPKLLTLDVGTPFHDGAIKYWKEVGLWKK